MRVRMNSGIVATELGCGHLEKRAMLVLRVIQISEKEPF